MYNLNMKIVFMGTPDFAACSLKALIDAGHEIPLVITQPDRKGNRNKMILSAVKQMALENGLEVAQPHRIRIFRLVAPTAPTAPPSLLASFSMNTLSCISVFLPLVNIAPP